MFAQHAEDERLAKLINWQGEPIFYIDVGAYDAEFCSVTKMFYDKGSRGINIEPVRRLFDKLVGDRPRDINLYCALSDVGGGADQPFKVFYQEDQTGFSTLDEKWGNIWGGPQEWVPTPVWTLAETCERILPREGVETIDFLKIDAENWEHKVIAGGDWARWRPRAICVECYEPCSATPTWDRYEPTLFAAGYALVDEDPGNRYYAPRSD